jgi:hypothetical protein
MYKKKNKENEENKKKDKKPSKIKQFAEVYKITQKERPLIWLWMLLVFLGVEVILFVVGAFIWKNHYIFTCIAGIPIGLLVALIVLTKNAESVTYASLEGQVGSSYAGLSQLKRGWRVYDEPVRMNKKGPSMVFRAIGRAGVILVAEGSDVIVKKLLVQEKIMLNRIVPNVPIVTIIAGNGNGKTPIKDIFKKVSKLKAKLTKVETSNVINRIDSYSKGFMSNMGIPKGIDPMNYRPSRKGIK